LGKGGEGSVGKKGKGMGEERKGYILGAAIVVVRLVGLVVVPGEAQKRLARLAVFHETKGGGTMICASWEVSKRQVVYRSFQFRFLVSARPTSPAGEDLQRNIDA
jgi:hypothetical protein